MRPDVEMRFQTGYFLVSVGKYVQFVRKMYAWFSNAKQEQRVVIEGSDATLVRIIFVPGLISLVHIYPVLIMHYHIILLL